MKKSPQHIHFGVHIKREAIQKEKLLNGWKYTSKAMGWKIVENIEWKMEPQKFQK